MNYNLRSKLSKNQFVVTVELDPPKGPVGHKALAAANSLSQNIDAVNVADSPMANMKMSPIALAHLIQEKINLETIFHLTCRDRNVIGLQSELLGAAALGVQNLLILTGDNPKYGDHPDAKGVFETDSVGLVGIANSLNNGLDYVGNQLNEKTDFFIGVAVNPGADDLNGEIHRFSQKIKAGANFAQTQPTYDLEKIVKFLEMTKQFKIPILIGLLPIKSYKMALYLNEKVPGISISKEIQGKIRLGGKQAGINLAREMLIELKKISDGVHIMPIGENSLVKEITRGII